jgi:hypothetical protein
MKIGSHSMVTDAQRAELWRRNRPGETVHSIANVLVQRSSSNIYRDLEATGGIAPAQRSRSLRVLSVGEREEISRGITAGDTFRSIARKLKRAVSTVSQEVARHGGRPRVGLLTPTMQLGSQPVVPSSVCSPGTGACSGQ